MKKNLKTIIQTIRIHSQDMGMNSQNPLQENETLKILWDFEIQQIT